MLAWIDDAQGRNSEAISKYRRVVDLSGGSNEVKVQLAYFLARSGDRDSAKNILNEVKASKEPVSAYDLAELYVALGDNDTAFKYLETAYTEHFRDLFYIRVDPGLDSIRADPRYGDLVRRIGLPGVK